MKKVKLPFYVIIIVSLLQNCNSKKTYKIEYKDDVKEIMNYKPLYGKEEVYSLELHHVFGDQDSGDVILGQPFDLVKDSHGNIFICDKSDLNIKKYDKDGNFVETFGRPGNGPGEFQYFQSMQIDHADNLYIHEASGRLQKITNDGQYVDEYKLPSGAFWFILLNKEKVVFSKFIDITDKEKAAILHVSNYDEDITYSFCKPQIKEDERMTRAFNFIWFTKDFNNNIIVNFSFQNRIEKYNQMGELLFRIKRKLNYNIYIKEVGENVFNFLGQTIKTPKYEYNLVSGPIGVDDENNIWAFTYQKPTSEFDLSIDIKVFEVYNSDGIWLTRVPVPASGIFRIFGDSIFLLDFFNTSEVYEYKIIKKL